MVLFTFDPASGDHDEPPVVVVVMRVMDAHGDLADSHHLLHGHEDEFHRQEADTLVKEVQGAEENQVPLGRECQASGGDRPWGPSEMRLCPDPRSHLPGLGQLGSGKWWVRTTVEVVLVGSSSSNLPPPQSQVAGSPCPPALLSHIPPDQ